MSVASEINRIKANIASAYDEAKAKGATMPAIENSANLADAVASIPTGSTPTLITKQITENGTYTAADDNADGYSQVVVDVAPDRTDLNSLIDGSITIVESDVEHIRVYAFSNCSYLTDIILTKATSLDSYFIYNTALLTNLEIPLISSLVPHCFDETNLNRLFLRSVTYMGTSRAFVGCSSMTTIVMGARAVLGNVQVLNGADNAIIYVQPNDLSWYETATNWVALYAEGRIKSVEDLIGNDVIWYQEQIAKYPIP